CASSRSWSARASRSIRVRITLPTQKAAADGTGSRYRSATRSPLAPLVSLARPAAATSTPIKVEPLTALTTRRTRYPRRIASPVPRSGAAEWVAAEWVAAEWVAAERVAVEHGRRGLRCGAERVDRGQVQRHLAVLAVRF